MALQLGALRDALLEAGASQDKATKASEEVAAYDSRLAAIEGRLNTLTWMVGSCLTLIVVVIGGETALWAKLGDISGTLARIR